MDQTVTADQVRAVAARGQDAAAALAITGRNQRDTALTTMADAVVDATAEILDANARDVAAARGSGTPESMIDRLAVDEDRVRAMADGLRDIAGLPDPLGEVVRGYTTPDGLVIRQLRVPFGVVAMIYEGRPNVTVDAAGLALKSGNVALLRGSASAINSNRVLVDVLSAAAEKAGLPADAVLLVPGTDRASVDHLLTARGLVDLVIPRGGAGLIEHVVTHATVPVIETGVGNCHVYVDAGADLDMAERIVVNSVSARVSVCNSAESVLVHRDVAGELLPRLGRALAGVGVTIHGDDAVCAALPDAVPAIDDDWGREYLSLDTAMAVVDDLDAAIAHIRRWSTSHTEAIVTGDLAAARAFTARVDSAAVMVNASTRFTDGSVFGFGAEIGISTQKMHARGPMGLTELTSTKWVVTGDGHVR